MSEELRHALERIEPFIECAVEPWTVVYAAAVAHLDSRYPSVEESK